MEPFVPIDKQSKKARRMLFKKQRGSWGAINPVTRKTPDPKVYKRKKIRKNDNQE
ncbi:MAG: hypothetical protein ACYCYI_12935 [Saccharofermentanales bacterium]